MIYDLWIYDHNSLPLVEEKVGQEVGPREYDISARAEAAGKAAEAEGNISDDDKGAGMRAYF